MKKTKYLCYTREDGEYGYSEITLPKTLKSVYILSDKIGEVKNGLGKIFVSYTHLDVEFTGDKGQDMIVKLVNRKKGVLVPQNSVGFVIRNNFSIDKIK